MKRDMSQSRERERVKLRVAEFKEQLRRVNKMQ
jgi:hypothetical protein